MSLRAKLREIEKGERASVSLRGVHVVAIVDSFRAASRSSRSVFADLTLQAMTRMSSRQETASRLSATKKFSMLRH